MRAAKPIAGLFKPFDEKELLGCLDPTFRLIGSSKGWRALQSPYFAFAESGLDYRECDGVFSRTTSVDISRDERALEAF